MTAGGGAGSHVVVLAVWLAPLQEGVVCRVGWPPAPCALHPVVELFWSEAYCSVPVDTTVLRAFQVCGEAG